MRASPAVQVTVQRWELWRAGVWALAVLSSLSTGAWLVLGVMSVAPIDPDAAILVAAGLMAVVAVALTLARIPAYSLRWDGERWHMGLAETVGHEPVVGRLEVTLDLGGWMLFRFWPDSGARWWRPYRWLPVQRRGLEAQWHALRCAVYSFEPSPPSASGSDPDLKE